ncbi:hypothetical protein Tco_0652802 [Tanacetum coccineum]|uniref:DUF4283 domain-containing protein n=1 Tax=Tanacetum coccineum TaxID=301880 RepID=A0ABQ4WYK4_9ASTR
MDLYHSRLTPDDLNDLIIKYKIPHDRHWVHFSQLGPLGLNKVITFEVLCRSLQIEPTHGKSGFFFIDRRAIPNAMVWRHLDAAIDDPRAAAVPLTWLMLSRIWKSHVCDPVLWGADGNGMGYGLPFYCTPPAAADAVNPDPTPEDLAVGTPSSKIVAKAKASHKRKASTSGATSSHVAKYTRSALAQASGSTTRPSLFVGDDDESDDDDDACVEILLVTPLCSAVVIPYSGNQGGSSVALAAEGSNTRDSRGKGVMVDDVVAPSAGVSRPRPSFRPALSFRDVSGDAIDMC